MGLFRHIARVLRSRRLAALLLVLIVGYAILATLLPNGAAEGPGVARWAAARPVLGPVVLALGLNRPFAHPVFFILVGLLTLATGACSVERTRAALRAFRGRGTVPRWLADRAVDAPTFVIPVGREGDCAQEMARALSGLGLRVRTGAGSLRADSPAVALIASPLLHWSLVLLFIAAAAGQMTRAEVNVRIPIDGSVPDLATVLSGADTASRPNTQRWAGLSLALLDFDQDLSVNGIARGASGRLQLLDGSGRALREGWVYPNRPLKWRGLTIHHAGAGPALLTTAISARGAETTGTHFFELDETKPHGIASRRVRVDDASTGSRCVVEIAPGGGESVSVRVIEPEAAATNGVTMAEGDEVGLPGGARLRVDRLTAYVRFRMVDDMTVPLLYLSFAGILASGILGLALPVRSVFVRSVVETGLHVVVIARRADPAFGERVYAALQRCQGK